jgi:RNA polymerase sigma-70 factor (ECF subfamily)
MKLGPTENHSPVTIDLTEHLDGLYSYAVVLSRNPTEAEDLVQDALPFELLDGLRRDSNVKRWLFTILRNIWLNQ